MRLRGQVSKRGPVHHPLFAVGVAFAVVISTSLAASAQGQDTIRVGIEQQGYPPFTFRNEEGQWTGWEIEFLGSVCRHIQTKCEIVEVEWDALIPKLLNKDIDVIWASMSITEDRRTRIAFSDKYYQTPAVLVGLRSGASGPTNASKFVRPEELGGKSLGVQIATVHQDYAVKYFSQVIGELRAYKSQEEANRDLMERRADILQMDSVVADEFLKSDLGQSCCILVGTVQYDEAVLGEGIGAGLRKEDEQLKRKIDASIAALRANGEYQQITGRYFSYDIYGQ